MTILLERLAMDDKVLMFLLNAAWGLILLFLGFVLKKMADDLKENTSSLQSLAATMGAAHLEAFKTFATKEDHEAVRQRVHALSNEVVVLRTREEFMRGNHGD